MELILTRVLKTVTLKEATNINVVDRRLDSQLVFSNHVLTRV